MSVEKGYFFIADFSGYTGFLAASELEHAKEISDTLKASSIIWLLYLTLPTRRAMLSSPTRRHHRS